MELTNEPHFKLQFGLQRSTSNVHTSKITNLVLSLVRYVYSNVSRTVLCSQMMMILSSSMIISCALRRRETDLSRCKMPLLCRRGVDSGVWIFAGGGPDASASFASIMSHPWALDNNRRSISSNLTDPLMAPCAHP
jgi:hypothetical protein